ncbi:MAG: hypothetical protein V4580_11295 [Bacteroidota bacterium]
MNFCINAEDLSKTISYRLQRDNTWLRCHNTNVVQEADFVTNERQAIINLLIEDIEIPNGDRHYTINPSMGIEYGNRTQLHYTVYCYRDIFPERPTQEQLENTLLAGNDINRNALILKTDGLFYLVSPFEIQGNDPDIVYQFASFPPNGGLVGPAIQDENFEEYTMNHFLTGMSFWLQHLQTKEVHFTEDSFIGEGLDDLLNIINELETLRNNF